MELPERLIVAADFKPESGRTAKVRSKVVELAEDLHDLGVMLKLNSFLRATGYEIIQKLHRKGLRVFADLKLIDIPNTLENDGGFLSYHKPEVVTVMAEAGISGMETLKKEVDSETEVLAVTVLTSFDEEECQLIYGCSVKAAVLKFARMAQLAGVDGLICSPHEAEFLEGKSELTLTFSTPGIRPMWYLSDEDDQARVMTPKKAILAGADRLVIGRPITKSDNPREAVERTLEEIESALEERET